MATIRYNIGADDPVIQVVAPGGATKGLRFQIDDELCDLLDFTKYPYRNGVRQLGYDNTRWIVNRGVGGSVAASHSSGATVTAVISASVSSDDLSPPNPVVEAGVGAVASVNGQTGVVVLAATDVGALDASDVTAYAGTSILSLVDVNALVTLLQPYFLEPD